MNFPHQPGKGDFTGRSSRLVQVIVAEPSSWPGKFIPAWKGSAYRRSARLVQNAGQIAISGNLADGLVQPAGGAQTVHIIGREGEALGPDQRRHDGRGIGIVADPQRMPQLVRQHDLQPRFAVILINLDPLVIAQPDIVAFFNRRVGAGHGICLRPGAFQQGVMRPHQFIHIGGQAIQLLLSRLQRFALFAQRQVLAAHLLIGAFRRAAHLIELRDCLVVIVHSLPVSGFLGRVKELDIGRFKIPNVITSFPQGDQYKALAVKRDGNLGIGILKRFSVIIDYPGSAVYLKQGSEFNRPFEHDMSGLEYYGAGEDLNRIIISRVEPGSPADEIGLEKDDEILAINLKPVKNMTLEQIDNIFKSQNDRSLLLEVYHDKKKDEVVLTLKRRI